MLTFYFFPDYMRRSVEKAQEAFDTFDNKPKDGQLTYQELLDVIRHKTLLLFGACLNHYFDMHACLSVNLG